MSEVNDEIAKHIAGELRPQEKLLWAGQPLPSAFRRYTWPVMLFGIPFFSFAVFWTVMAVMLTRWGKDQGVPPIIGIVFPLWGIPFMLVGAGLISAPYWATRRAKRSWYALTNERAIVTMAGFWNSSQTRSFGPETLATLTRNDRSDGSGDLIFEPAPTVSVGQAGPGWAVRNRGLGTMAMTGFVGIADVREVERLVRAAFEKAQGDKEKPRQA
jgi:hypothetical protein